MITFLQEVDEENPEHAVLTSGPTSCRTKNDNSDEEIETINNVSNNPAAIERLGRVITNTSIDIDNANHNQKGIKSSFEEFSRSFVGYKGTKNNRNNVSNLVTGGLSFEEPIHQLDNMPRIGGDSIPKSITEGKLICL